MKIKELFANLNIKNWVLSLTIGIVFAVSLSFAWNAVWHGTNWVQTGKIITSREIAENLEFLYQRAGKLPAGGCQNSGEVLQWDGAQFICATVSGGSSSACSNTNTVLANGSGTSNTVDDCLSAGGTAVDTTDGCLCKMSRTTLSCPSGWTRVSNWSETVGRNCGGGDWCSTSCYTGQHVFANRQVETCYYNGSCANGDCAYCSSMTCKARISAVGCK